ncbi:hypothetical protein GGI19_002247 [Coemansia pectinata]|uniref:Uncharacterized protein n=1 Tax=Coemansia pectinata TaxID=1052879 RepID=A0A9W8H023_9FUNG|nr:hypothetical protein GGI19_002247 [Coemansia pectinata]
MERRSTTKGGTNKRQDNAVSFYKRVHGTDEQNGEDKQGKTYYYAAAEDDKLGWSLGDDRIDPMYTMRRREQEQEAHSKDSFYKKLKVRIGQSDPEPSKPEPKAVETVAILPAAAIAVSAPSTGAMRFGFGMMTSAAASRPDVKEKSKDKKDKKDKKSKDKTGSEKASKKDKKDKKRKS